MDLETRREGAFVRFAGGVLVFEGVMVVIHRFLIDLYLLASEVNHSDESHVPLTTFLPLIAATAAVATVLIWAGAQLRRYPPSAWRSATASARVDLVLAALCNLAIAGVGIAGLVRGPAGALGAAGWSAATLSGVVSLAGLARDALKPGETTG
jgi:hypothetical protein